MHLFTIKTQMLFVFTRGILENVNKVLIVKFVRFLDIFALKWLGFCVCKEMKIEMTKYCQPFSLKKRQRQKREDGIHKYSGKNAEIR
jgi:hypothetical protein